MIFKIPFPSNARLELIFYLEWTHISQFPSPSIIYHLLKYVNPLIHKTCLHLWYKVLCSWNKFFMECEGDTREVAEQKAAFKMVNQVRDICGLEKIPEKIPTNIECIDSSEIVSDADIPEEIKVLLMKNESVLCDRTIAKRQDRLHQFNSLLKCPILPGYSITNVNTEGCKVYVSKMCL